MAMNAMKGMVGGAMNDFSTAFGGSKTAASREHALAVSRDYISQPRLSKLHQRLLLKTQFDVGSL